MNSLLLHRLVKVAPIAMAAFAVLLMVHGVHVGASAHIGTAASNVHVVSNGDPGGIGGPS